MPLTPSPLPENLVTFCAGGTRAQLNLAQHKNLSAVKGSPEMAAIKGDRAAAEREALAALILTQLFAADGAEQTVYLGDEAVQFLYNRKKRVGELDCDVVARVRFQGSYGFVLAEGKGSDLAKAYRQFQTALHLLRGRGPVRGAYIVTNNLRWLEWNPQHRQWQGMINNTFDQKITEDIQPSVLTQNPPLVTDKIYLLDSPHPDGQLLPSWCLNPGGKRADTQIYDHDRSRGAKRTLRKVLVGDGPVRLIYVK